MRVNKELNTAQGSDLADDHAPRKMTFRENVILTIKVLAVLGLLGTVLLGINFWTSPR